jgi:hypothetical protein
VEKPLVAVDRRVGGPQNRSGRFADRKIISPCRESNFKKYLCRSMSRDSSVGIATGYGLDDQGGGGSSSPGRVKNFHFSISSRLALGSTQAPIKWVPAALSRG